jgi:hypothetical protein
MIDAARADSCEPFSNQDPAPENTPGNYAGKHALKHAGNYAF